MILLYATEYIMFYLVEPHMQTVMRSVIDVSRMSPFRPQETQTGKTTAQKASNRNWSKSPVPNESRSGPSPQHTQGDTHKQISSTFLHLHGRPPKQQPACLPLQGQQQQP